MHQAAILTQHGVTSEGINNRHRLHLPHHGQAVAAVGGVDRLQVVQRGAIVAGRGLIGRGATADRGDALADLAAGLIVISIEGCEVLQALQSLGAPSCAEFR